jgi:hypothetical protein
MRYRFRLDRGERAFPDPASRFQPEGPHGPSEIVDPGDVTWSDGAWCGRTREQLVIYEMHVGTFTPDGSWESAPRELPALAELGITCLEIMPVADFPDRFGWGYDGVNLTEIRATARLCRHKPVPDQSQRAAEKEILEGLGFTVIEMTPVPFGLKGAKT